MRALLLLVALSLVSLMLLSGCYMVVPPEPWLGPMAAAVR